MAPMTRFFIVPYRSGTVPPVPTPAPTNSPAHSPPKTKTSYRLWPFGGGNSHHKSR